MEVKMSECVKIEGGYLMYTKRACSVTFPHVHLANILCFIFKFSTLRYRTGIYPLDLN